MKIDVIGRVLMTTATRFVILPLMLIMMAGCGGDKLPRVPVSGKVTLDGQPLPLAQISFVALPDDVTSIRPQSAGQIKDGIFQIKSNFGPVPGEQMARIVLLKEVTVPPDPASGQPQPGVRLEESGTISIPVEIKKEEPDLILEIHSQDIMKGEARKGG